MEINITFLGTSQAIPTKTRNHTSILLEYKDENLLIDCGEGTQRQFRIAKLNPCKITRLLITHWHGDHVLGLPGLFQTLALNNYQKTLQIYGPKGTKKYIEEISKIFLPLKTLKINIEEVSGKFFENNDFELYALNLDHSAPTNGYYFKEKDKLRIDKEKLKKLKLPNIPDLGKLVEGKNIKYNNKLIKSRDLTYKQTGKKISFIFDTKVCENAKKLAKSSDLAIIESTYSKEESDLALENKHMTTINSSTLAKQNKVKKLILTHISQRYEYKEDILLKEAKEIFKDTIIASDFMKITV